MAKKSAPADEGGDDIRRQAIAVLATIGIYIVHEVGKRAPDIAEWTVDNVPKAAKATGRAGWRTAKWAGRGAQAAGAAAVAKARRSRKSEGEASPEAQHAREDDPARETPPPFDRAALDSLGFAGFLSVEDLWNKGCQSVPIAKGIYAVLRDDLTPPTFLAVSGGGHFKGKDPSVPVPELEGNWVGEAYVLYVGQAGGGQSNSTLRDRVTSLVRFANGKAVGHWGGRLLWQVEGSQSFLVAWKVTESSDPLHEEAVLIEAFRQLYDRLPFANLKA